MSSLLFDVPSGSVFEVDLLETICDPVSSQYQKNSPVFTRPWNVGIHSHFLPPISTVHHEDPPERRGHICQESSRDHQYYGRPYGFRLDYLPIPSPDPRLNQCNKSPFDKSSFVIIIKTMKRSKLHYWGIHWGQEVTCFEVLAHLKKRFETSYGGQNWRWIQYYRTGLQGHEFSSFGCDLFRIFTALVRLLFG